ncbi:MAG TPA: LysE family translocator [Candidatus Hydrogenedentes bacterium]|nr:LysE family translocator [Candidatus Hydrogenedentota bacterium]
MNGLTLLYFLGASVLLTLAPGPDNTFVVAQGLSRGRRAAIITAVGMCSGVSIHTTAAALGISALLYSSAYAFLILKYAGAAYLLFLAYKAIKEHTIFLQQQDNGVVSGYMLFRRGFIMNVLNPKVGLFFLAFLPQFISPDGFKVPVQMLLLGLIFMVQAVIIFSAIGYLSGSVGNIILTKPGVSKYFAWLTAGIFASLGLRLAFAQR